MSDRDSVPPPPVPLATHFASPQRASPEELERGIRAASNNPVIDALISAMSGLLAVLNEQRQVLALNQGMLALLGTCSMKLLGERFLGGKVSFTSSPQDGTCFRISLPGRSARAA